MFQIDPADYYGLLIIYMSLKLGLTIIYPHVYGCL